MPWFTGATVNRWIWYVRTVLTHSRMLLLLLLKHLGLLGLQV